MPRRSRRTSIANSSLQPTPEQPISLPLPTSSNNDLVILRSQWKWAAFSQFMDTFSPLLNMSDVSVTDIENDLVLGTRKVIPRIIQRLLYTLTYDRKISLDNWQLALRKQFMKRDPSANPLGPEPSKEYNTLTSRNTSPQTIHELEIEDVEEETVQQNDSIVQREKNLDGQRSSTISSFSRGSTQEVELQQDAPGQKAPIDWFDLSMLVKLDCLHFLGDWQFQNPLRLRTLMKSDDELATWRHEPIGWDSKRNAYWLIGGDRLWIQRTPPKPPKLLKRKRVSENRPAAEAKKNVKRPRIKPVPQLSANVSKNDRQGRAAKLKAKRKLDEQAKALAELNRHAKLQNTRTSNRKARGTATTISRPLGTRVSARLRGTQTDEWQATPDEWLDNKSDSEYVSDHDSDDGQSQQEANIEGSISDLTELSDDSDDTGSAQKSNVEHTTTTIIFNGTVSGDEQTESLSSEGFNEWETICVTLDEWEHIADRFAKATHYLERALYKHLTSEIVPDIVSSLKEIERKQRLEDAIVHRKRSSRLAVRESEREEARLAAQRKAEEEEKMSRTRRLEARQQREEEERLRRERARDQRRKEREARELRRQTELVEDESSSAPENQQHNEGSRHRQSGKTQDYGYHSTTKTNGSPSHGMKSGDWEVDCEICQRRGINIDDSTPMMSCGKCLRWQHIACHDQADERAHRTKRNWDVVEFICQKCRARMFSSSEVSGRNFDTTQRASLSQPHSGHLNQNHQNQFQQFMSRGYTESTISNHPSTTLSTLYHAANGHYSHYRHPYGNMPVSASEHPATQPHTLIHPYNAQPTLAFSHYQPREGNFDPNVKAYPSHREGFGHHPIPQPAPSPYNDTRSGSNYRPISSQATWSIATPTTVGDFASQYHNGAQHTFNSRRDIPQDSMPGPSSSLNQPAYFDAQYRYNSTT